jgi:hypothetical protein
MPRFTTFFAPQEDCLFTGGRSGFTANHTTTPMTAEAAVPTIAACQPCSVATHSVVVEATVQPLSTEPNEIDNRKTHTLCCNLPRGIDMTPLFRIK